MQMVVDSKKVLGISTQEVINVPETIKEFEWCPLELCSTHYAVTICRGTFASLDPPRHFRTFYKANSEETMAHSTWSRRL